MAGFLLEYQATYTRHTHSIVYTFCANVHGVVPCKQYKILLDVVPVLKYRRLLVSSTGNNCAFYFSKVTRCPSSHFKYIMRLSILYVVCGCTRLIVC